MDLQQLTQSLRDPAVFAQHVKTNNALKSAGLSALVIAALLFAYNAFSVFKTLGEYNIPANFRNIWHLLWSTQGENAGTSFFLYLYVWGAPILLLAGIGLLVAANATKGTHSQSQHQRYLSGGYVARQEPLGLKFADANQRGAKIDLVVLTHPAQRQEDYAQMMAYLRGRVQDKEEGKRVSKAMARVRGTATPLSQLMPDLTAQNLVAGAVKSDPVVVMPPAAPGGKVEILATAH